jgi:hypothetical protein
VRRRAHGERQPRQGKSAAATLLERRAAGEGVDETHGWPSYMRTRKGGGGKMVTRVMSVHGHGGGCMRTHYRRGEHQLDTVAA